MTDDMTPMPLDRRSRLRNLAAETRRMIAEDCERRAKDLAEAVHGGPVGASMTVDDAFRSIEES